MVPVNGWFIMENAEYAIRMDDLQVPLFQETSICLCKCCFVFCCVI